MLVHRFGVQKHAKLEKKGVLLVVVTNFGKDMTDKLRKMHTKACISGLLSYQKDTCLGCVLKVFLQGWYPAWSASAPPPGWNPKPIISLRNSFVFCWFLSCSVSRISFSSLAKTYQSFCENRSYMVSNMILKEKAKHFSSPSWQKRIYNG